MSKFKGVKRTTNGQIQTFYKNGELLNIQAAQALAQRIGHIISGQGFCSCSVYPCHCAIPTTPPEERNASVSLQYLLLHSPGSRKLGIWGITIGATCGFTRVMVR